MTSWESAWLAKAAETTLVDASGRVTTTGSKDFLANTHGKLRLVAKNDAGEWILHEGGAITIGRRPDQDLVLTRRAVSGKHAALLSYKDSDSVRFCLQDWSSKGSYVNGTKCFGQRRVLKEGDVIHFGEKHFSTRLDIVQIRPINSALPPSILQENTTLIDATSLPLTSNEPGKKCEKASTQEAPSKSGHSRARERARGRLHPLKPEDEKKEDNAQSRRPDEPEGDHNLDHSHMSAGDAVAAELERRQRRTRPIYSRGSLGVHGSQARRTPSPILKSPSASPSRTPSHVTASGAVSPTTASASSRSSLFRRHESAGDTFELGAPLPEREASPGLSPRPGAASDVRRQLRSVRKTINQLAPLKAASVSSWASGDESETTIDEFGVVHHHHVFHDEDDEPEFQEIEPKYRLTDRVMFKHRLHSLHYTRAQKELHAPSRLFFVTLDRAPICLNIFSRRVMFKHRLVGVGMVHACGYVIQMKTHWIEDDETGEQHKGGFSYRLKCQSVAGKLIWLEEDKITCRVECEPNENIKPIACEERQGEGLPSGFT